MFNFSITNRKKLVFVLLLGLSSCQKAKNNSFSGGENGDSMKNSSQNRPEIKVSVTKKDREGKNISLLPHLSLNWDQLLASDTLQFKLDIQTREAEVKMNWTTNCQFGAENKTQQGSFQLPIEMKVSQFLPHSFFFNPQHPYGKDIPCSFSFSAKQEATGARHEFSYKAPLYLDHSGQIHIEELYSRNYLSDQVELKELQLEVFNQLRIIFPLDHRLDLECSRFRSPLIIEKNLSPVVGTPIWIDEKVESRLPMQEFPLQICRIIGKKEGLIASWSPYFILKSKTKGLSFSWTSSPSVKKYTIGDPLPTIDLGTLSFKNDQSYPQSLRIPKYADFDILPLCFIGVKVRPAPLVRRVPGRLSSQEGLKILSQDNQAWVIKLSPLAQSQVIYESSVNLDCQCPLFVWSPNLVTLQIAGLQHREGGYFLRHHKSHSPLIQILAEDPYHMESLVVWDSWQRETPHALSWVTALRTLSARDYREMGADEGLLGYPIATSCN